ncbi:MAG: hypothetical protein ACRD4P_13980, partial [Bryobacteraceae bacterium]
LGQVANAIGVIYEGRLEEAIKSRGVSFSMTPVDVQKLKMAGATAALLAVISSKAPAATPAPAPPPPVVIAAGPLSLTCVPEECQTAINDAMKAPTENGQRQINGLKPGTYVVDFQKDGYIGQQKTVQMKAKTPNSASATLLPSEATQQKYGTALLAAVINKLGGDAALQEQGQLTASGHASLWSNGERTDWSVIARLKVSDDLAYLEISGAGVKWWTSLRGGDSKSGGSGKIKGTPIALDMEKLIHQFRDYQLAAVIGRIRSQKMKLASTYSRLEITSQVTLKATSPVESYVFSVPPSAQPSKVTFNSASGLGSGLEVVYADYTTLGGGRYPKAMQIALPDQSQHGIELHFDEVSLSTKLSSRDFHR